MSVITKALMLKAVKEPEKTRKGIFYILIGVMSVVLIIGSIVCRLLSCFTGYSLNADMDVTQTEIYYFCEDIKGIYEKEIDTEMEADIKDFCEKNSYKVVKDKVTVINGKETVEKVEETRCDWYVEKYINDISNAYIMAFISTKYDIKDKYIGKYVDAQEILDYLHTISVKEQVIYKDSHMVYYFNNLMGLPEIIELYFPDEEQAELYLESFKMYNIVLKNHTEPSIPETGFKVPQYFQTDYDSYAYGNGTISTSGCAPTCLAMVLSYLTDEEVTPVHIVSLIGTKYYVAGKGSGWDIFPGVTGMYDLECKDLGLNLEAVKRELLAGKPVIASMGPGLFTQSGHFIVIRGMDGYMFLVNDPNRRNVEIYDTDRFSVSQIMSQCKNFWSFSKGEVLDE